MRGPARAGPSVDIASSSALAGGGRPRGAETQQRSPSWCEPDSAVRRAAPHLAASEAAADKNSDQLKGRCRVQLIMLARNRNRNRPAGRADQGLERRPLPPGRTRLEGDIPWPKATAATRPLLRPPPLRSIKRRAPPPLRSRTHERQDFELMQLRHRQNRGDSRTRQETGRPCRRSRVLLPGQQVSSS
ncbi:hypothetical protein Mesau_05652 [Mesorhizobium australicum WSM2073]|uniref:Uncharacterized protein n=3 Tax=Mesorhizobium TaxID=68287 RepID=L0KRA2_MESAW|nr:hypothetical protein Mesci_5601 [Mesorhizobium ciceri biovar biserrulae WSM1271]AEH90581.1 hypothetical protein Mesop_6183 [Mesorhizobium opportunistum WSM2075]AGB47952.1 hypothetical protein Mesau_05652 [Mesorhizobium australicum WSM2073]